MTTDDPVIESLRYFTGFLCPSGDELDPLREVVEEDEHVLVTFATFDIRSAEVDETVCQGRDGGFHVIRPRLSCGRLRCRHVRHPTMAGISIAQPLGTT